MVRAPLPPSVALPPSSLIVPLVTDCAALIVRLPPALISNVWLPLVRAPPPPPLSVIAVEVVALPSILRVEADAEEMRSVTEFPALDRSSMPPCAVMMLLLIIEMLTVPKPVTFVLAPSVPSPLMVPPFIVMPLVSVSVALDPRVMWPPAASVSTPVTVRSPLFTANVPVTLVPADAAIVLVPAVVIVPALAITPVPVSCRVPPLTVTWPLLVSAPAICNVDDVAMLTRPVAALVSPPVPVTCSVPAVTERVPELLVPVAPLARMLVPLLLVIVPLLPIPALVSESVPPLMVIEPALVIAPVALVTLIVLFASAIVAPVAFVSPLDVPVPFSVSVGRWK